MPGRGSLSRASSLRGADSRGLAGQAGPAEGWLLPGKARGSWYFPKLELPAQVVPCTGVQGDSDLATETPIQTSAAPAKGGDNGTETLFGLQANTAMTGLPLKWAKVGEGEEMDIRHRADLH